MHVCTDLTSVYTLIRKSLGEWSLNPCELQGKNPLYRKIFPEEDRTRDAVDSEPKHYQRAIQAPNGVLAHWTQDYMCLTQYCMCLT